MRDLAFWFNFVGGIGFVILGAGFIYVVGVA